MVQPFPVIATAVALSPNLEANLCESVRIKNALGAKLYLIHVEKNETDERAEILKALEKAGCSLKDVEVVWERGDEIEAILRVCEQHQVNLLIAGALPREGLIRYYKGSIARQLVRKSNCSILLLTQPKVAAKKCESVVVNGLNHPKTAYTIETAVRVCEAFGANLLRIVEEVPPSREVKRADDDKMLAELNQKRLEVEEAEDERIDAILAAIQRGEQLTIRHKAIIGKPGYTIGHFTQSVQADLLVLNSPDTKLGFMDRVFTHGLEYILSELPSDILIVHSHA